MAQRITMLGQPLKHFFIIFFIQNIKELKRHIYIYMFVVLHMTSTNHAMINLLISHKQDVMDQINTQGKNN